MADWIAWYLIEDSKSNPDITEWDSEEVKTKKLQRIAEAKRKG